MPNSSQFHVRTHRSLHDVVYRLLDAVTILVMTQMAIRFTPELGTSDLIVIGAATLLVHMVATEVSALYRSWRGSRLIQEAWCVVLSWIYTAPTVLGLGMLTQYNAQLSYTSKLVWLLTTPVATASARIVFRMLLRALRKRGFNTQRFAICGVNKLGIQLARNVQDSPELGMEFAGFFDDRPESRTERSEERRVGKECRSRWSPYH